MTGALLMLDCADMGCYIFEIVLNI